MRGRNPDGRQRVCSAGAKIVAAIKQLSGQPIRYLVNTHDHGDHTGGDENFAKLGAVIVAREEIRHRLLHPGPNGAAGVPASTAALPTITCEGQMRFHAGGEDVGLTRYRPHRRVHPERNARRDVAFDRNGRTEHEDHA